MRKRILKVLRKAGLFRLVNVTGNITVNGKKFVIPVINEIGFENYVGLSEPWMLHLLDRLKGCLNDRKSFFDVGVNLGQTLLKLKSVSPTASYVGFEPNPLCVNYLVSLIAENRFANTEIMPVGIGDQSSVLRLRLFTDSDVDSSASIIEGFRDESKVTKTINVPVFRYSDIPMDGGLRVGILKIDVEGAELEVIKGLKEKIASDRPIMLVEVLPAYHKENKLRITRQEEIQRLLAELEYKMMRVVKKNNHFIKVQEISEFGIHADLNMCEYIFVPSELADDVRASLV